MPDQDLSPDTLDFFLHHPTLSNLVRAAVCDPDNTHILDAMIDYCQRNGLQSHADAIKRERQALVIGFKADRREVKGNEEKPLVIDRREQPSA